jgi:hypothetical protein
MHTETLQNNTLRYTLTAIASRDPLSVHAQYQIYHDLEGCHSLFADDFLSVTSATLTQKVIAKRRTGLDDEGYNEYLDERTISVSVLTDSGAEMILTQVFDPKISLTNPTARFVTLKFSSDNTDIELKFSVDVNCNIISTHINRTNYYMNGRISQFGQRIDYANPADAEESLLVGYVNDAIAEIKANGKKIRAGFLSVQTMESIMLQHWVKSQCGANDVMQPYSLFGDTILTEFGSLERTLLPLADKQRRNQLITDLEEGAEQRVLSQIIANAVSSHSRNLSFTGSSPSLNRR